MRRSPLWRRRRAPWSGRNGSDRLRGKCLPLRNRDQRTVAAAKASYVPLNAESCAARDGAAFGALSPAQALRFSPHGESPTGNQ